MIMRTASTLMISIALLGCTSIERAALPDATLLDARWQQAAAQQAASVDHGAWDTFLSKYLSKDKNGINRLDYAAVSGADRSALSGYLRTLQGTPVTSLSRDQQLAIWVNLYNAKTVDIILEDYPVDSILKVTDGLLPNGPWNRKVLTVEGEVLSLNDVEHRIVRPVFNDARIHYALTCAAAGCPNLMPRAWRAEMLEADLAAAERAYINDPRGVSVNADGSLTLSKIYTWFREDFGADEEEILAQIAAVAEPDLRAKIENRTGPVRYEYDWALNDVVRE